MAGRKRTGRTPHQHFRAPDAMWAALEWVAGAEHHEVSWVARDALTRRIAAHFAARRGATSVARDYWADTEGGESAADPSEAELAALIAGINGNGNTFVAITPAGDTAAWYVRVGQGDDGTYEVERFGPSLRDHRRAAHPSAEAAARALFAWLAQQPR